MRRKIRKAAEREGKEGKGRQQERKDNKTKGRTEEKRH
jgi:hypothetical protein